MSPARRHSAANTAPVAPPVDSIPHTSGDAAAYPSPLERSPRWLRVRARLGLQRVLAGRVPAEAVSERDSIRARVAAVRPPSRGADRIDADPGQPQCLSAD